MPPAAEPCATVRIPRLSKEPLWLQGPIWYDGDLHDGYRWRAHQGDRAVDLVDLPAWLSAALVQGEIQAYLPPLGSYVTALVNTGRGDVLAYPDDIILRHASGRFYVVEGTSAYLHHYTETNTVSLVNAVMRRPALSSGLI